MLTTTEEVIIIGILLIGQTIWITSYITQEQIETFSRSRNLILQWIVIGLLAPWVTLLMSVPMLLILKWIGIITILTIW